MLDAKDARPTAAHARAIAERYWGRPARSVERFSVGAANYVYDVRGDTEMQEARETRIVVRFSTNRDLCVAAVRWNQMLRPLGVPLPELLAYDFADDGAGEMFPFMILAHVPGADLNAVYPALSADEKRTLAQEIAAIQARVGTLPHASGYGYARAYDDPALHPTWEDVLLADLARSRRRIVAVGAIDPAHVDRVAAKLPAYHPYFAQVPPTPFLDDTTTQNVLVAGGKLSGIVDVDYVCFGDPLLTPALTRMALLSQGFATDYTDYWCAALGIDAARGRVLTLYTALFCVNFMSELGQRFNKDAPTPVDPAKVATLTTLLDELLAAC